jgi:hypothetical protein
MDCIPLFPMEKNPPEQNESICEGGFYYAFKANFSQTQLFRLDGGGEHFALPISRLQSRGCGMAC